MQGIIVKATQPDDSSLHAEQRGLGWSHDEAMRLLSVVWMFLDQTGGGLYTRGGMTGIPPLDTDDGQVLQAARMAGSQFTICERFCLTYDKQFVAHMRDYPYVRVVSPGEWCTRLASQQRIHAMKALHTSR